MFHRHDWKSISVEHYQNGFLFTRGPLTGQERATGRGTTVLQRCKCEKVRTIDLEGTWTLEQVTRKV
jgi:hypothetical protein